MSISTKLAYHKTENKTICKQRKQRITIENDEGVAPNQLISLR